MFYLKGELLYLYSTAISVGLMVGMKYSMLILALPLQIFIMPRLFKIEWKKVLLYISLILLFGGYWYLRNYIELRNPMYPINVFNRNMGIFAVPSKPFNIIECLIDIPWKIMYLFAKEPGIGSLHGGFGIIFWGISLPAWFFLFFRSLIYSKPKERLFPFFFWAQLVVGFIFFALVPIENLHINASGSTVMFSRKFKTLF